MQERWINVCAVALAALGAAFLLGLEVLPTKAERPGEGRQSPGPSQGLGGSAFVPHGDLTGEESFGQHTVRTYRSSEDGAGSYEVLQAGRRIYGEHGWWFGIGGLTGEEETQWPHLVGRDITGNGRVNVVIYEWTGGVHCAFIASVLELDGGCRLIARINGMHSPPVFRDVDGDSFPEVLVQDWTFAYWPTCFAKSPAPYVVLRWSGKEYQVAADLMRSPAPTASEFAAKAAAVRSSADWGPEYRWQDIPEELFSYALDLMYSGHEEVGWRFIEMAWPKRFAPDTELLDELKWGLESSDYWCAVKRYYEQRDGERARPDHTREIQLTRHVTGH
jgi:hypothetical protein